MYTFCLHVFLNYITVVFILFCIVYCISLFLLLTSVCWRFLCVAMCTIYTLLELLSAQYLWCAPTTLYPFTVQGRDNQTVSTHHTYNSAMEFFIMNIFYITQSPWTIYLCNLSGDHTFYIHRPDSIRSSNF